MKEAYNVDVDEIWHHSRQTGNQQEAMEMAGKGKVVDKEEEVEEGTEGKESQEHAPIAHQGVGAQFSGVYYVEAASIRLTVNGKEYTDLMLRDRSGSRPVKFWGKVDGVEKGGWVFVAVGVEEYQGAPSMIARNLEVEKAPEDLENFIPTREDVEELAERFDKIKAKVVAMESDADRTCSRLIDAFCSGTFFSRFAESPGGVKPYYGCIGGLLASVVRVAETAESLSALYPMSDMEKVIMLTSALVHRVGGVDAYSFNDCMPAETSKGVLIGVKGLTVARLTLAMRAVFASDEKGNPAPASQKTAMKFIHAVMSHDAVGVAPATQEALVLNAAWRADAECVEAVDFIQNDLNKTDEFTAFDPNLKRRYYRG
jgi:23S rRNA maturation-related 3'-5' exoribonuclease YhaM